MNSLNYFLVIVAIAYLIIGTIGFLYKKWGIEMYIYLFVIVSITIFIFGIAPIILPHYSISRQFFTILISGVGSVVVAKILLKMIGRKNKN